MKKRRTIMNLLGYFSRKEERVSVTIKGNNTGQVLYEGSLWQVPYGLCTDYVLSYTYIPGHLEIILTCSPHDYRV